MYSPFSRVSYISVCVSSHLVSNQDVCQSSNVRWLPSDIVLLDLHGVLVHEHPEGEGMQGWMPGAIWNIGILEF